MTRRLSIMFSGVLVIALAATLPLKLALDWAGPVGLGAGMVSGSVWDGRVDNASFHGTPLGTLQAGLDPIGLFTGMIRMRLTSEFGRFNLVSGRQSGFGGATVEVGAKEFGLPLAGRVRLTNAAVVFGGDRCVEAMGRISSDAVQKAYGGPELTGGLTCVGKDAVARLGGTSDGYDVAMTVTFRSDGRYRAESIVTGASAVQESALALAGFSRDGDALHFVEEGFFPL